MMGIIKKMDDFLNDGGVERIRNIGIEFNDRIRGGGFLSKDDVNKLLVDIESGHTDKIDKKWGIENDDIRTKIFNYENPLSSRDLMGVNLRIAEGIIERENTGKRVKTYLLYADGEIIGKFYSVEDIKRMVKYVEDNL